MFLVRRNKKIRLMSFKSNPWLGLNELPNADPDIYKNAIFLFSGKLEQVQGNDNDIANRQRFVRRFNSDKIQSAQLITKSIGSYQMYIVIVQFNSTIVQLSLNKPTFKIICEPEAMVRRHMVRGYNEQVYFAESSGNAEKIFQIEFHPHFKNEITKKEIFQLAGSWLVAFEADGENIQNDVDEVVPQSLYIMDDQQKIFHIKNEDNVRFAVSKVIDFSHHEQLREINDLRDNDWQHVHITESTLSFGDMTYNLKNKLSTEINVPHYFFGQDKGNNTASNEDGAGASQIELQSMGKKDEEDDEDDDSEEDADEADESQWTIQSVQNMSMTTNMISTCQRNHKEFCFVVKPAPGSRKVSIVGYQQLHEISQMLFVSNSHVLLKFRGDKAVTLLSNGCIHQQPKKRIQRYMEEDSKVVGESQIYRGHKTVLFEQEYGDGGDKERHVALQFDSHGDADIAGIYTQFKDDMAKQLKNYQKVSPHALSISLAR